MSDDLEERLRNHARSFDSLLSLIPAKLYYGVDVSDQWKKKKQTQEQKRAAKMAKLDPDNWKSAKDILDERSAAAKRKRDEAERLDEGEALVELEQPKSVQDQDSHKAKKRKTDDVSQSRQTISQLTVEEKKQKSAEKKAVKKERAQKEREKLERQKARKQAEKAQRAQEAAADDDGTTLAEPIILDKETTIEVGNAESWSTASSSEGAPEIFSPPAESGTSSISSLPPSLSDQPKLTSSRPQQKSRPQDQPSALPTTPQTPSQAVQAQSPADHDAAKARLATAISSFRSARKADEPIANKPRNRAELLEQRRRKEEAKRLAKKEQRRKEREEQARKEDEEIARRFSPGGSGSLLASPRSPPTKDQNNSNNTFSYGRIEFKDGTQIDSTNMDGLLNARKRKGPQDAQTALKAAQNKAARLSGLDEEKRKTIEEKDVWLNAKRRVHGERVKDNTSLLKKALKRHDGQKKKSEKEWSERKEGVAKAQQARQKKRTENLAKRREEKLAHKAGKKGTKVKKRPGFEGSLRGRTGAGGKKKK